MTEILYCGEAISQELLEKQCGIKRSELINPGCTGSRMLVPDTPYLLGKNPSVLDREVQSLLSPLRVSREVTRHVTTFGGDDTLALSEFSQNFRDYNMALTGAATTVYANRMNNFGTAVQRYQDALLEYRDASRYGKGDKKLAQLKVTRYFDAMQKGFQTELAAINTRASQRKRSRMPAHNVARGINLARDSRKTVKLDIMSQVQAENLVNYTKYAKFLGNGLVVIDVGSRIASIHNEYQADGDWERELFIESSSFAAGAVAGGIAVRVGLTLLIAATPMGWVGIIVVAAAGSMATNYLVKEGAEVIYDNAGDWYDAAIDWVKSL